MIRKMRENTKVVLWILVLAFVATIVFSWGMGGFSTVQKGNNTTVAVINGEKVDLQRYEQIVRNRLQREEQQNGTRADENAIREARRGSWNDLVNLTLEQQVIDEVGYGSSEKEISDRLIYAPPAWVTRDSSLQTAGVFDTLKWKDFLRNPQMANWIANTEASFRETMPLEKLRERFAASMIPSEADLMDEYISRNQTATARYLLFPFADYKIDSSRITDNMLQQYYREHREEYKVDETREIQYVQLKIEPSAEDSADARDQIHFLQQQLADGQDFGDLARYHSGDESNSENGGDLGWFNRNRMVKPFSDAAFDAEIGSIVGPIETRFGLHLIKVNGHEERENEQGEREDMVNAQHILIKVQASSMTYSDLRAKADAIYDEAQTTPLARVAELREMKISDGRPFTAEGSIPGVGRNERASALIFAASEGDVLQPVYVADRGWYVISVTKVNPAGVEPFEARRDVVYNAVTKQLQTADAQGALQSWLATHGTPTTLDSTMAVDGAKFGAIEEEIRINQYVRGDVGRDLNFTTALFAMQPGTVSAPIEGQKGLYLIECITVTPVAELTASYAEEAEARRNDFYTRMQNGSYGVWAAWIKERSSVEDHRSHFGFDY